MLKKNDIISLEITGMTNEGNGVGRYNGIAVFVPMTAVGDIIDCRIVKVQKSFCYGIIENIVTASDKRVNEDCIAYSRCGGCSFRHFSYKEELRIKEEFVRSAFERIGKIKAKCEPILGCEKIDGYRNKAQYPVAEQDGKAICGFYSRRSHRVTGIYDCALQPKIFTSIVTEIMDCINAEKIPAYNESTGQGLVRHIYIRRGEHSGEIMVCIVVTDIRKIRLLDKTINSLTEKFHEIASIMINENPEKTNVIMGKKFVTVYGKDTITDIMCGNKIELSPKSFYQVNTIQAEKLYGIAKDYAGLKGSDLLLDLYCGAGTIGLSMSDSVKKLIGVEIIDSAIENAKENARANGIKNAEFICGDAGKISEILYDRGERPAVIIADPARKGCDRATLEYMVKMSPDRIVMISCNPATAARDCAILDELGYHVERYRPVDLFPRTTHVETVCLLSKLHADQHIEVELQMDELDLTAAESKATYEKIKEYVLEKELDTEAVIQHYDALIDEGNDPVHDPQPLREYMDKWDGAAFIDQMQFNNNKAVLEIGVGTGRLAVRTAPLCSAFYGIDISPKTIEQAKKNLASSENVTLICADFLSYKIERAFDVVYSSLTFMHIKDKLKAINKIAGLLNDAGRFVLSIDRSPNNFIDFGTRRLKIYPDKSDAIAGYIRAAGLTILNQYDTEFATIFTAQKDR